jgi:hypothetical protein
MKRPSKLKAVRAAGSVLLSAAAADPLAWLGAAYAMSEDAYVLVDGDAVVLWPKSKASAAALTRGFAAEYENQAARWATARANLGVRAEVLRRSLALLAARPQGGDAPATLDPAQAAEIKRLLAEAENDPNPRDPLGIATPWSELRGQ